jgi:hypothetical protein
VEIASEEGLKVVELLKVESSLQTYKVLFGAFNFKEASKNLIGFIREFKIKS